MLHGGKNHRLPCLLLSESPHDRRSGDAAMKIHDTKAGRSIHVPIRLDIEVYDKHGRLLYTRTQETLILDTNQDGRYVLTTCLTLD